MREAPMVEPSPASGKVNQPAGKEKASEGEAASAKGKKKKKDKKKTPRGGGWSNYPARGEENRGKKGEGERDGSIWQAGEGNAT
jgi:hypothetical protein